MRICKFFHALFGVLLLSAAAPEGAEYRAEIEKWRKNYEADLKKDDGWLTVSGLWWLKQGDNSFGTGLADDILLPEGSAPPTAGVFTLDYGKITLRVKAGLPVLLNRSPVDTAMPIRTDWLAIPDRITLGRLSMIAIRRGDRYGIRLWDNANKARDEFAGIRWFDVDPGYRVTAQFTSYPAPKNIPIKNVIGDTEESPSPGYATFTLNGKQCHLEPILEGNQLFFMLKDLTSGRETYPAGRFLYADLPKDGKVVLDFNKAYNPPCAFTPYATCPLPPKQNYLPIAIRAGAMTYPQPGASH